MALVTKFFGLYPVVVGVLFFITSNAWPMVTAGPRVYEDPYLRWLKHAVIADSLGSMIKDSRFLLKHYVQFVVRTAVLAIVLPQFKKLKRIGSFEVGSIQRTLAAMAVQLTIQNNQDLYELVQGLMQGSLPEQWSSPVLFNKFCGFCVQSYALVFVASMLNSRQSIIPVLESFWRRSYGLRRLFSGQKGHFGF